MFSRDGAGLARDRPTVTATMLEPRAVAWRQRVVGCATLVVPGLLALVLCLVDISTRSIWLDESATIAIASQHGSALWAAMRHDGGNMLAYYALVHLLISAFGNSTLVLRLPSAIATGLSAVIVAAIGRRLVSPEVGLGAGLLAAVSLPFVYWGQDARAYSFMFAFVSLSYLAFVELIDGESRRQPGSAPRWARPVYVVALVLASYMSFVSLLVVPAQLASLAWKRTRLVKVLSALVVVALCDIPVALLAAARGSGQLFWVPRPALGSTGQLIETLFSAGLPPLFRATATTGALIVLTSLTLLAGAGLALARRAHMRSESSWAVVLVAAWLVVPTVLDLVESAAGQSIFEERYLLMSAPAVALALAWAIRALVRSPALAWCGIGVLLVLRLVQVTPSYGVSPENWEAASHYLLAGERAGDCVAFYPSDGRQAVDYYLNSSEARVLARPVLPSTPWRVVKPFVEDYATLDAAQVRAVSKACGRLWLVASHFGQANGTSASRANYRGYEALLHRFEAAYASRRPVLASFGYADPVYVWLFGR
jgi:mannosyltransferase